MIVMEDVIQRFYIERTREGNLIFYGHQIAHYVRSQLPQMIKEQSVLRAMRDLKERQRKIDYDALDPINSKYMIVPKRSPLTGNL